MTEQSPWGQPPQQSPYGQPPSAPYSAGPPPPPGGGYPAPGYGGPQGPQGPKKSRTGLIVGAVVAVVVVIGLVVGGVVIATGGDDSETAGDDTSESASESATDEATEDSSEEPTEEPTDDNGGQTSDGTSMFGNGYEYALPGAGWKDSTDEAQAAGAGSAIDTMSILGPSIELAQSNILVEAGPSGGEDVEALQAVWQRNITGTDGAEPVEIDGRDIDGEQAVGLRIERVNNSNQDITQIAYLVVHDDMQYSVALSFPRNDPVSEQDFTKALDSWTWE